VIRNTRTDSGASLRQVFHPPIREWQYWAIQLTVALIAGVHIFADQNHSIMNEALPAGMPVALLIIPVGYAAIRYGLAGSAATSIWATLLWLPDLFLPHGHIVSDAIDLVLIDLVAIVFGQRIELERFARSRAERETAERISAEASYRQLFELNRAPIVVLDSLGRILDANPAARTLFESTNDLSLIREVTERGGSVSDLNGLTVRMPNGQDYRIGLVELPGQVRGATTQLIFEDVTAELGESRRATQYARLVLKVEEEQRRRLARELHDEPLQLFLHLARRLENLGSKAGVPDIVSGGLDEARRQAIDAAARLRVLARDLRPPALDRLGLVPALNSLLSDVEEETNLTTAISVVGDPIRLSADLELGAFRIIQESVHNAIKHADAKNLNIKVTFEPQRLTVEVHDDGHGFVPEEVVELGSSGMGILGMHERANILAGHLDIDSNPGEGTTTRAELPISE
jgi:signal transduction histidine kinase